MGRPKPVKPFWSDTFQALAEEKDKPLDSLADSMGMTLPGLRHWLNGHRQITLTQFLDLCRHATLDPVAVLYPGYIPNEFREKVAGLAKDVLTAKPADKPTYRKAVAKLKRKIPA